MRSLWTLAKVVIGLAIAIPVALIALGALGVAVGVLGALVGLAALALKLAVILLLAAGCVRLVRRLFRGPAPARPVAGGRRVAGCGRPVLSRGDAGARLGVPRVHGSLGAPPGPSAVSWVEHIPPGSPEPQRTGIWPCRLCGEEGTEL